MSDRAVIYTRVSTEEQNASNQLPAIEAYCAKHTLRIVQSYEEDATAWKNGHQRELKRLLEDAARRRFDVLVIWALNRLSREGPLAVLQLIHKLKSYGVRVISYQEPWLDSSPAMADVLIALLAWVAKYESDRRSERIKAGLARRKRNGGHLGRKPGAKDVKKRDRSGYYARWHGQKN